MTITDANRETIKNSTFCVLVGEEETISIEGTAFAIDSKYALTSLHVFDGIEDLDNCIVKLQKTIDHRPSTVISANIEKTWSEFDIALMKLDQEVSTFLSVDCLPKKECTNVLYYGYPHPRRSEENNEDIRILQPALAPRFDFCIISSLYNYLPSSRSSDDTKLYTIDKNPQKGSSGSPVILKDSINVFGIVRGPDVNDTNYGIVISLENIREELMQLINH